VHEINEPPFSTKTASIRRRSIIAYFSTDRDKLHSLAHKIRAIADEIESEMPLVNRVAGRTTVDPTPDQVHVGSEAPPVAHSHDEHEHEGAPGFFDWVRAVGGTGLRRQVASLAAGCWEAQRREQ